MDLPVLAYFGPSSESNESRVINPIMHGGGVFRTPSNFVASGNPLRVRYIDMFHADFSYLSI